MPEIPLTHCMLARRIKLYNRAHELSQKAKDTRLKREYRKMREIKLLIFFMDVGREGASHRARMDRNRKVAEMMAETDGISIEKASAIVNKSIETQEKSNAARAASFSQQSPKGRRSPAKTKSRRGGGNQRRSNNSGYRRGGGSNRGSRRGNQSGSYSSASSSRKKDSRRS